MSDNLDKLDFDISYSIIFGKEEVDLIDIYEPKASSFEVDMPEDKFVTFSSDLSILARLAALSSGVSPSMIIRDLLSKIGVNFTRFKFLSGCKSTS